MKKLLLAIVLSFSATPCIAQDSSTTPVAIDCSLKYVFGDALYKSPATRTCVVRLNYYKSGAPVISKIAACDIKAGTDRCQTVINPASSPHAVPPGYVVSYARTNALSSLFEEMWGCINITQSAYVNKSQLGVANSVYVNHTFECARPPQSMEETFQGIGQQL